MRAAAAPSRHVRRPRGAPACLARQQRAWVRTAWATQTASLLLAADAASIAATKRLEREVLQAREDATESEARAARNEKELIKMEQDLNTASRRAETTSMSLRDRERYTARARPRSPRPPAAWRSSRGSHTSPRMLGTRLSERTENLTATAPLASRRLATVLARARPAAAALTARVLANRPRSLTARASRCCSTIRQLQVQIDELERTLAIRSADSTEEKERLRDLVDANTKDLAELSTEWGQRNQLQEERINELLIQSESAAKDARSAPHVPPASRRFRMSYGCAELEHEEHNSNNKTQTLNPRK